ncbi:MAG: S9 family peptidase [Pseudomonadota bacterium]
MNHVWQGRRMAALVLAVCGMAAQAAQPTLEDFTRDSEVTGALLSPDGNHIALRVLNGARATLQIRTLPDFKVVGTFGIAGQYDVADFWWKNDERLLVGTAERLGTMGKPRYTATLMAVNIDGSKVATISRSEKAGAYDVSGDRRDFVVVDPLVDDHDHALISRYEMVKSDFVLLNCNVYVGTCKQQALPRLKDADFWTDDHGELRGQSGETGDGKNVLLYRDPVTDDWKEFDSYFDSDGGMSPQLFDSKGKWVIAYDNREDPVSGVYKVDLETRKHEKLFLDPTYDVSDLIRGTDGNVIGASVEAERQRWVFFDAKNPDAMLYSAVRRGLGNVSVYIVNFSRARDKMLVLAESDVAPASYYVIDLKAKSIGARIPTRPWIDPAQMASRQSISFQARDGLTIHGYLTVPRGRAEGTKSPLIVLPHGGPYDIQDTWEYDSEVQLLANHGYAVLQINFRGSGGYGREFRNKGYGEWGRAMQDDVADGTRWAAGRVDIDVSRTCIYGASYGAYAALVGVERHPELYRCAAGYAGVYDLQVMWNKGDIPDDVDGRRYLKRALGDDAAELAARSPVNFADKIQVPVFLAHGSDDQRAPVAHFKAMRDALQRANKPVETLLKDGEGHGFYAAANKLELYTKLLAFLDRNLGVKPVEAK